MASFIFFIINYRSFNLLTLWWWEVSKVLTSNYLINSLIIIRLIIDQYYIPISISNHVEKDRNMNDRITMVLFKARWRYFFFVNTHNFFVFPFLETRWIDDLSFSWPLLFLVNHYNAMAPRTWCEQKWLHLFHHFPAQKEHERSLLALVIIQCCCPMHFSN